MYKVIGLSPFLTWGVAFAAFWTIILTRLFINKDLFFMEKIYSKQTKKTNRTYTAVFNSRLYLVRIEIGIYMTEMYTINLWLLIEELMKSGTENEWSSEKGKLQVGVFPWLLLSLICCPWVDVTLLGKILFFRCKSRVTVLKWILHLFICFESRNQLYPIISASSPCCKSASSFSRM